MTTKQQGNYLTDGIAISVFTLLTYIIAFQYESGFCEFWKIPTDFIDISLTAVIFSGLAFGLFVFLLFMFLNNVASLFKVDLTTDNNSKLQIIFTHVLFFIVILTDFLRLGATLKTVYFLAFYFFMYFLAVLWPWLIDRKKHDDNASFSERILRTYQSAPAPTDGYSVILRKVGTKAYNAAFIMLLIPLIAFALGTSEARATKTYLIIESENLVLLKRYGETYLLRPIDFQQNTVGGDLLIWRSEDVAKHKFQTKELRHLKTRE